MKGWQTLNRDCVRGWVRITLNFGMDGIYRVLRIERCIACLPRWEPVT